MSITSTTKFLIVDDLEPMRKAIIHKLRALGGQHCVEAADGKEALSILKQQSIDVILCDDDMPIMSGLELLKAVKSDTRLCTLPFVMISAESSRGYLVEVISSGVSSVLIKPYTLDGLAERIEKAIKNTRKSPIPVVTKKEIPEPVATKAPIPLTILVVDDTPDYLELLTDLFKDEYRVRVTQSGGKAIKICTSDNPPDLIILDVMMPVIDGFEVTRCLREHPNTQHIPIIFITSLTSNDIRMTGLDLGAVDFVTKPIDAKILKARVRNIMRYVNLHKQLQADYDEMLENSRLRDVIENITRYDLKVPLIGIVQLIETMLDNWVLDHEQLEQLRITEEIALQTIRIISISTELYKIESNRFELDPQPVKIDMILLRLVQISRETFYEKQLELIVETNLTEVDQTVARVLGDVTLCYSLFHNLINNACEYALEKSYVTVSIHNENPIRITIQNEGVVPMALREPFFEKYLDSISTKWGGAYATKLMTEAQHGNISLFVSDKNNLTTITVYLPKFIENLDANTK